MIRQLFKRAPLGVSRRRANLAPLIDLPGILGGYVLPDGTPVGEVDEFCTRLVIERTAYRPKRSGSVETDDVAAAAVQEEEWAPFAAEAGEPHSPPDDPTQATRARVAEDLLDELAQALADVTIPGVPLDADDAPGRYRLHRQYAEAALLAGWRPRHGCLDEVSP